MNASHQKYVKIRVFPLPQLWTCCSPARVHVVLADAAPEETFAAVAAGRAVVFACGSVTTYGTQAACPHVARGVHVSALSGRGVWHKKRESRHFIRPETRGLWYISLKKWANVLTPRYNSQAAKWCFCFTKRQAGLIKDGVNGQWLIKPSLYENLRGSPAWVAHTKSTEHNWCRLDYLWGGNHWRQLSSQPHSHQSGSINHALCQDTCYLLEKKKSRLTQHTLLYIYTIEGKTWEWWKIRVTLLLRLLLLWGKLRKRLAARRHGRLQIEISWCHFGRKREPLSFTLGSVGTECL